MSSSVSLFSVWSRLPLYLCHLGVTKSACPTAAEKCLPTAICPRSRWRSQPLSRVSRKQRYNTPDFAEQNRVPRWTLSPLDTPAKGNAVSLWIPYVNRDARVPVGNPAPKGGVIPSFGNLPNFLRPRVSKLQNHSGDTTP